jgi:hypothetical protein
MQVRMEGTSVQVTLNGQPILAYNVTNPRPQGRIGLQLYPTRVEFRNMRVREASTTAAAASAKEPTG